MRWKTNSEIATLHKMAKSQLRTDLSRAIFMLLSIILTTTLLTALLSTGSGLFKAYQEVKVRASGHMGEALFENVSIEEAEQIYNHELIEEYGLAKTEGLLVLRDGQQSDCLVKYIDGTFAKYNYLSPDIGRLPLNENEVAMPAWILDEMGYSHDLGQNLVLQVFNGHEINTKNLSLVGIWDMSLTVNGVSSIIIGWPESGYTENFESTIILENNETQLGGYTIECFIAGEMESLISNYDRVVSELGLDMTRINGSINNVYVTSDSLGGVRNVFVMFGIIFFLTSGMLIYNVYEIYLVRDVKHYGLLRIIGATKKQITTIINYQSLMLCLVGIPFGLLLGYVIGVKILPLTMSYAGLSYSMPDIKLWILLIGAVFALATVFMSSNLPVRKIMKVDPNQAIQYTGYNAEHKKRIRAICKYQVFNLACVYFQRNIRKNISIIATFSAGLILFSFVNTLSHSVKPQKYLDHTFVGDIVVMPAGDKNETNTALLSWHDRHIQKIACLENVEKVYPVLFTMGVDYVSEDMIPTLVSYYKTIDEINNRFPTEEEMLNGFANLSIGFPFDVQIYGIDADLLYLLNLSPDELIDIKAKFLTGNYVIIAGERQGLFSQGDNVDFSLEQGKIEHTSLEVLYITDSSLAPMSTGTDNTPGYRAYIPAALFTEWVKNPQLLRMFVDTKPRCERQAYESIQTIASLNANIECKSQNEHTKDLNDSLKNFNMVINYASLLILVVGFINLINSITTNIYSREKDYALLQCVGMTRKQLILMVVLENVFIAGIAFISMTVISIFINNLLIGQISRISYAYELSLTMFPYVSSAFILLLCATVVPSLILKLTYKSTVIDDLRAV